MKNGSAFGLVALTATAAVLLGTAPSHATAINDLFVFGDSYSDTGAYFPLTNGSTAVGYLAQDLGITLTTSKNPNPGTDGVNFAQSGAKIAIGPTPPATQPLSLTQQVAQFQAYVEAGTVSFNPASSVFMLLGGLNDHTTSQSLIASATTSQVATLYSLGARLFDIALNSCRHSALRGQRRQRQPGDPLAYPAIAGRIPRRGDKSQQLGSRLRSDHQQPRTIRLDQHHRALFRLRHLHPNLHHAKHILLLLHRPPLRRSSSDCRQRTRRRGRGDPRTTLACPPRHRRRRHPPHFPQEVPPHLLIATLADSLSRAGKDANSRGACGV